MAIFTFLIFLAWVALLFKCGFAIRNDELDVYGLKVRRKLNPATFWIFIFLYAAGGFFLTLLSTYFALIVFDMWLN